MRNIASVILIAACLGIGSASAMPYCPLVLCMPGYVSVPSMGGCKCTPIGEIPVRMAREPIDTRSLKATKKRSPIPPRCDGRVCDPANPSLLDAFLKELDHAIALPAQCAGCGADYNRADREATRQVPDRPAPRERAEPRERPDHDTGIRNDIERRNLERTMRDIRQNR